MKTLILLFILSTMTASAQIPFTGMQFLIPSAFTNSGGTIYLVNQNFESVGTPVGWTGGIAPGDYNFNSTSSPLAGLQSLHLDDTVENAYAYTSWSDAGVEIWGEFLFRANSFPASFMTFFTLQDTSLNQVLKLFIFSNGNIAIEDSTGNIYATTVANMSLNTVYYVWVHYKSGTGVNSTDEVWFSTSSTNPGSGGNFYAGGTTGHDTTDALYVFPELNKTLGIMNADYDNIMISTTKFW